MRKLTPVALLALTVTFSSALQGQIRMAGGAQAPSTSALMAGNWGSGQRGVSISIGSLQRPFHHRFFPQPIFFGETWFNDYPQSSPPAPQVIVLQQPAATAAEPKEEPRPITPLLIELHGDRYVRSGGSDQQTDGARSVSSSVRLRNEASDNVAWKANAAEMPPVVLVFRDAHREEIDSYAIFGGTIYINSNYWSSGAWSRRVQLADLDLPGTLKLNRERGVKFILPGGPNEVVTRP